MKLSNFDQIRLKFLSEEDQEEVMNLLDEIRMRKIAIEYYLQRGEFDSYLINQKNNDAK